MKSDGVLVVDAPADEVVEALTAAAELVITPEALATGA